MAKFSHIYVVLTNISVLFYNPNKPTFFKHSLKKNIQLEKFSYMLEILVTALLESFDLISCLVSFSFKCMLSLIIFQIQVIYISVSRSDPLDPDKSDSSHQMSLPGCNAARYNNR